MGNSAAVGHGAHHDRPNMALKPNNRKRGKGARSRDLMARLLMPTYYDPEPLTDVELALAISSWNDIINDSAPRYKQFKEGSIEFAEKFPSALDYLTAQFFARLFDVHPACKFIMSKVPDKKKFLMNMVQFLLSDVFEEIGEVETVLTHFATAHHKRGVRTVEYGVVGEVLFYALKQVLGILVFSVDIEYTWVKVYSRFLGVVVPISAQYELNDKIKSRRAMRKEQNAYFENIGCSFPAVFESNNMDGEEKSGL